MKRILVIGALPESLFNFRGDLIKFLSKNDFEVIAMSNQTSEENVMKIEQLGAKFQSYEVNRHSKNPINEIKTFINLVTVIKRLKPDYILAYTVKPIVWVGISMFFYKKIKFIALIEGLGYAFQKNGFSRKLLKTMVCILYKVALIKSNKVIFLNEDNKNTFVKHKIINPIKCNIIDGIGVNLNHYSFELLPAPPLKILMISRFLNEKGVKEYIKAAEIVKLKNPNIEIKLLGDYDNSSDTISKGIIEEAVKNKYVELILPTVDIRPYLKECHLFVLPSYHEGMPRTIMEAMATGRPILTTNVPGCKNTVDESVNGFLVEKQDYSELANKMIWFSENLNLASKMGEKSREIAVKRFDVNLINKEILSIINKI